MVVQASFLRWRALKDDDLGGTDPRTSEGLTPVVGSEWWSSAADAMRKERRWGVRKFGKLENGDWICQLTAEEVERLRRREGVRKNRAQCSVHLLEASVHVVAAASPYGTGGTD